MSKKDEMEVSESQIAVHWQEEDYYYPSEEFVAQANVNDKSKFMIGSAWRIFLIASRNMLTSWIGMKPGIPPLIPVMPLFGNGL
jgi:hypothetical protein